MFARSDRVLAPMRGIDSRPLLCPPTSAIGHLRLADSRSPPGFEAAAAQAPVSAISRWRFATPGMRAIPGADATEIPMHGCSSACNRLVSGHQAWFGMEYVGKPQPIPAASSSGQLQSPVQVRPDRTRPGSLGISAAQLIHCPAYPKTIGLRFFGGLPPPRFSWGFSPCKLHAAQLFVGAGPR